MGAVKFFDSRKGFGYIKPDQEITWEDESTGEGLYFSRDAILTSNSGKGMILRVTKDLRVSFKVYNKSKKSAKKQKTKQELIDEREIDEEETTYTGTVKSYNPEKEFGFITISDEITYNGVSAKERIFVMKEDIVCYSEEVGMTVDNEVMFKIYKDSKGLGAYEVMNEDGTPIVYGGESKKSPSPEPVKPKKRVTKKVSGKGKKRTVKRRKKN